MPEFTAVFEKIPAGYLGRVLELPEVRTEGADLEECRLMLMDAIDEVLRVKRIQGIEPTSGFFLVETISRAPAKD